MNIQRLLFIAREADKNGDYVTADKVDNLLKTAQNMNSMPQMPNMPAMPQMNPQVQQQPRQQGGIYYAPVAPGATYYTPGVVNVAQPQMTEEQKLFADLRGMRGQVQQADQVVQKQRMKPKYYPINQSYQQPVYQGANTQDQYNFNPNAPTNINLYGTGYASKAMQPQQSFPQANHSGDFYFKSDNGGPIDQSMNVALGTQNTSANYKDGNPDMTSSR